MKKTTTLIIISAVAILLFFNGCDWFTDTKKVRPHQAVDGHVYCTYEVESVKGGGAIPIGSIVCIYCEDPFQQRCPPAFIMVPAEGISYQLKKISNTCVECPDISTQNGWTYELLE